MTTSLSSSPSGKENSNPSTTQWKIQVPATDHRLALTAISDRANLSKSTWVKQHPDAPKNKRDFHLQCIDQTAQCLKNQLESLTVPVEDTEVERVLDSFKKRELMVLPNSPGTDYESCQSSSSSDDDDDDDSDEREGGDNNNNDNESEFEFDDEEIIDQEAYAKVKQFRCQARDIAMRIMKMREEVCEGALALTQWGLDELLRVHGFSEEGEEGGNSSGKETENRNDGINDDDSHQNSNRIIEPMSAALQSLTSSLRHVDTHLADKLQSMKETMQTIDSSIQKYHRVMCQGEENVLSQTEKALYSVGEERNDPFVMLRECMENKNQEGADGGDEEETMNEDARLALLLAGAL